MTATCVAVVPERQWDGREGKMQQYRVTFDNGDTGEWSGPVGKPPRFTVGETAQYEKTDDGRGHVKIKPIKQGGFGGGGHQVNEEAIMVQVAFKGAIDLIAAGKIEVKDLPALTLKCANLLKDTIATIKATTKVQA